MTSKSSSVDAPSGLVAQLRAKIEYALSCEVRTEPRYNRDFTERRDITYVLLEIDTARQLLDALIASSPTTAATGARKFHDDPDQFVVPHLLRELKPDCCCGVCEVLREAVEEGFEVKSTGESSSPAHEPDGWQPIETAPKDGKALFVAAQTVSAEPATTMFAYWNHRHGWWYRFGAQEPTRIYPTHWRPLPAPPSGDDA